MHNYLQVSVLIIIEKATLRRVLLIPRANGWGFCSDFFGDFTGEVCSLRQINLENDAIVEKVAGTTLDKIAPTKDLPLSSESLPKDQTKLNQYKHNDNKKLLSVFEWENITMVQLPVSWNHSIVSNSHCAIITLTRLPNNKSSWTQIPEIISEIFHNLLFKHPQSYFPQMTYCFLFFTIHETNVINITWLFKIINILPVVPWVVEALCQ